MLQQLLRRLVFDVPQLNEYCKMPLKVNLSVTEIVYGTGNMPCKTLSSQRGEQNTSEMGFTPLN